MRPEEKSQVLLNATRARAKLYEYNISADQFPKLPQDPANLFVPVIGILGDAAVSANQDSGSNTNNSFAHQSLNFTARFLDSYFQAHLEHKMDAYVLLLGSASFYLNEMPGSSLVLIRRINSDAFASNEAEHERLLYWILRGDYSKYLGTKEDPIGAFSARISKALAYFYYSGESDEDSIQVANTLKTYSYLNGTPRQVLLADIICAVLRHKLSNCTWHALPLYSGLSAADWSAVLNKGTTVKEFWPAQHLIGGANVLKGESAIIQLPTSVGKTKAAELIIRSAFLAGRTNLCIVVAPFRALCHELRDSFAIAFRGESIAVVELSDVLQVDFESVDLSSKQVLVMTPEKLLYALRHSPQLADGIGLAIFDEAHQFDNDTRGITYELLLTSLRTILRSESQKVLISAVISNAQQVGEWFIGERFNIAIDDHLLQTHQSVGFVSWPNECGEVVYVTSSDLNNEEFVVPCAVEPMALQKLKGQRKVRYFPDRSDHAKCNKDTALYLGLRLCSEGSVAIFCGRKDTASGTCERLVDVISRGLDLPLPIQHSAADEVNRLRHVIALNLGEDSVAYKCASIGVFAHHGNTPQGIKLAIESAMRQGEIRVVVCTSTLAQGVNLPIRYLIVTGVYQGREPIKVRDFQNLIGRAGRAGMHTEGSIIFADAAIYDGRTLKSDSWRWQQAHELFTFGGREPCASSLLALFAPIKSDNGRVQISQDAMFFIYLYINNPDQITMLANDLARKHKDDGYSKLGVQRQIENKVRLIGAIESFLMTHWDDFDAFDGEQAAGELARQTLAYHLADSTTREHITELFTLLAGNILKTVVDPEQRRMYGRTLYGLHDVLAAHEWIEQNMEMIVSCDSTSELLDSLWPLMLQYTKNSSFSKCSDKDALRIVARGWVHGLPFHILQEVMHREGGRYKWGESLRDYTLDQIVDLCEVGFGFEASMIVGAANEIMSAGVDESILALQRFLQKQLKYGLPSEGAISLYELGMTDRPLCLELVRALDADTASRPAIRRALWIDAEEAQAVVGRYPRYFQNVLSSLLER